jgi:transcriptional regulator with XRE-family HTH domain
MRKHAPTGPHTLEEALTWKMRELLLEKGWSQQMLAQQLDLTQATVSAMLTGKRRSDALQFYERLAALCGVRLSVLIYDLETRVDAATRPRAPRQRPLGERGDLDVVPAVQDEEARKQQELQLFTSLFHEFFSREYTALRALRAKFDATTAAGHSDPPGDPAAAPDRASPLGARDPGLD